MDMDTLHIYVVEIEKNFDFCPIRIIRGRKEEDEQKKKTIRIEKYIVQMENCNRHSVVETVGRCFLPANA